MAIFFGNSIQIISNDYCLWWPTENCSLQVNKNYYIDRLNIACISEYAMVLLAYVRSKCTNVRQALPCGKIKFITHRKILNITVTL